MARLVFLCDLGRCIECNACVTACKSEHQVPWGTNRRRTVVMGDGGPGERTVSVACMHCADPPCAAVCPEDCFSLTPDGVVNHDKSRCIGCGYCLYACPFGAPQFPGPTFGARGAMDKCTYCAGAPGGGHDMRSGYGRDRLGEGKLPLCAEVCATKALLAGDLELVREIHRQRVLDRGGPLRRWGWAMAYDPS